MCNLVNPHGAKELKPLMLPKNEYKEEIKRCSGLKKIPMSTRELSDLLMLGMGAYTPLNGFMNEENWRMVSIEMHTTEGIFWPIPITLSTKKEISDNIKIGEEIALTDGTQKIFGSMKVQQKYKIDKDLECMNIYRTKDQKHPGVAKIIQQGDINLAGPIRVIEEDHYPKTYEGLYFTPTDTRNIFRDKGWSKIAAFQTRNPMHRSHEYLAKIAIEICDGVLIHQVLGALKPGDIPAEIRVKSIDTLVKNYFVKDTVVQAGYPIEMRYGGPREALLHAVFRQNFGCSHLVVGRDHAGIGSYYGPFDAHHIFDEIPKNSLEIQPLKIDITFYCYKCKGMATGKTCPHSEAHRLNVSGTRLREMFANGEEIPQEFSRPEVIDILKNYYKEAPG